MSQAIGQPGDDAQIARFPGQAGERRRIERVMATAESDRQLIAEFAARHQQRPVRPTIGHAQCMVVDRVPGQELVDHAAGRVGLCTQRAE